MVSQTDYFSIHTSVNTELSCLQTDKSGLSKTKSLLDSENEVKVKIKLTYKGMTVTYQDLTREQKWGV